MSKKISTIGYQIPGKSELTLDFSSQSSLMDADIILMAPDLPYYERSSVDRGYYQGRICYGQNGSFLLKRDLQHWKSELMNAFKVGKTVFLFLSAKKDFFVDTGNRSYSGTGRSRSETINVAPADNYEFLPIRIGTINSARGTHIDFTGNPLFNTFFNKFKNNLEYHVCLEDVPDSIPVFRGKDKSKILGAIFKVGAGHLATLPYLNYDEEEFTEFQKVDDGKEEECWTDKAIEFGNIFIECLLEIDKGLSQELSKTPTPKWASHEEFSSKAAKEIQVKIGKNDTEIQKREKDNKKLQINLREEQVLTDLLFEQGKPLENAVIKALKTLGYKAENYDDGELELDQIIVSPEGDRYIGECEGKDNKDINITKFRQLVDLLNADFARDQVEEKAFGILFGNAERLKEPKERTLDFTEKCKNGAKREQIALAKTIDLFTVAKYLNENKDEKFKKRCREAIRKGLGGIIEFPTVPGKE